MTRKVSAKVVLDMPREAVWNKLRDISLAHNYVPGIVKTVIVSEQVEGIGASRYVYRNAKSYIQETVVDWSEGEGFLIRLHRGTRPAPPFRNAWFRYQLADGGEGKTEFTASLEYELPWGALGAWLEKKMEKTVQATIRDVASSMKLFYETGRPTTPAALKAYKSSIR
ncbi:MAG: SRPBCC family protein [Halioglobus sp.]|nr:SRPBCC family protein [Halioglobus sp.]MCB1710396.1 SRPBCC family protein [Halioglobus sp.]MCP5122550.1 SRPBCC family protein [Pseudomonadales bacterium]MCP5191717.1 SRPBCC family protein [Pseudomonadales bacterium]